MYTEAETGKKRRRQKGRTKMDGTERRVRAKGECGIEKYGVAALSGQFFDRPIILLFRYRIGR